MEEKRTQACQYCDRKFISEGTLKRHKNVVHKVQNEFQCELCEFKTKKKEYLTSHFMAIHNKIKLECHICLQVFPSKRCLSRHTKSRHTESVQTYKCDVCKESFTQKNILLVHYNSVSHLHKLKRTMQEQQQKKEELERRLHDVQSKLGNDSTKTGEKKKGAKLKKRGTKLLDLFLT